MATPTGGQNSAKLTKQHCHILLDGYGGRQHVSFGCKPAYGITHIDYLSMDIALYDVMIITACDCARQGGADSSSTIRITTTSDCRVT
ncbi:hypothetical protein E3N88_40498 [Mikania micrantha]|uniref:Uncharacterized protein n=1 Tax=Mikania micrantha TaxID=192012 RepID=A0A5N6LNN4_9ASTR|nr:hypothetical protein E3N88_40498 [Mikania micrantha]